MLASLISVRFDYWEVRENELLHYHGILANLERYPSPNLRVYKEINDIFEFLLLRSGRLIIHMSGEKRAIILDNVPWIEKKEAALTRMLETLDVQVRTETRRSRLSHCRLSLRKSTDLSRSERRQLRS